MTQSFPVSIIINNYNYGRFLPCAIDSALAQSYPDTEVVVVDDGSSDDSRAVIAAYGDRITPVFKENGGQASALNAGFARSHGDVVIFLDADDMLHPNIVEHLQELFRAHDRTGDQVARVQYRLQVVDAKGAPLGFSKPPQQQSIPSGDLRQQVLLTGMIFPGCPPVATPSRPTCCNKSFQSQKLPTGFVPIFTFPTSRPCLAASWRWIKKVAIIVCMAQTTIKNNGSICPQHAN